MMALELCEISLVFREIKTVSVLRKESRISRLPVPNQTVTVKYNADKTTIPFF